MIPRLVARVCLGVATVLVGGAGPAAEPRPVVAEVRDHLGRPTPWGGDAISAEPLAEFNLPPDEQVAAILAKQPESRFFVRFSLREPESWRKLLEEKVLQNRHVVMWGPGTGISDGDSIGTAEAAGVAGFEFDLTAPDTRVFRLTPPVVR